MFIQPPDDEKMKQSPLAYVLEGKFSSYFAGKDIPEKPAQENEAEDKEQGNKNLFVDTSEVTGQGQIIEKGKPGKIFVIGTSEILKNDLMMDDTGRTPNAMMVMNVIDYLNNNRANVFK